MAFRMPLVLALTAFLAACEQEPVAPTETAPPQPAARAADCKLVMGWDPWEPYHYRDIGGEVRGLDVELVTAISREAGCSLSFDQEDWSTLLSRLREGGIDLVTGATRTPAREGYAHFSDPYRSESFRLYVRAGEAGRYEGETLEELLAAGMTIGTTLEYVYSDEVTSLEDGKYADQFEGVAVSEVNYDKLINFQIDGFLEDPFVAAAIIRKKGLDDQIERHQLVISDGNVHMMFSRASVDDETLAAMNAALGRLRASGDYDRIIARYLN